MDRPINELLDFYSVRSIYFYFNSLLIFSKEMPKCFPSGIRNPLFSLGNLSSWEIFGLAHYSVAMLHEMENIGDLHILNGNRDK